MMKENKIESLLKNHKTHWQWYKTFFNITVLRYLVTWFALVPIIVKLIKSFHPTIKVNNQVVAYLFEKTELSAGWQILWLSSLCFVVGLLIYQFACPGFIKTYSSFADYKKHLHSPRWVIWESIKVINDRSEVDKFFQRLKSKNYIQEISSPVTKNEVRVEQHQTVVYFTYQNKFYKMGMPILGSDNAVEKENTEIAEKEIFWEIFGRLSSSRKYIRLIILVLLFFSAILFAYTLYDHIVAGFKYIF